MTTILYHNNMLLADSRTSRKPSESTGSRAIFKCVHCGEKPHTVRDNASKIRVPIKSLKFRGELIRAVAGCGDSLAMSNQLAALTEMEDYEAAYTNAWRIAGSAKGSLRCRIMIVTEKQVHVINYEEDGLGGLIVDSYPLTETVTIGSGSVAAKTAILAYNADAFEAMRVAGIVDKATGGAIRYVDLTSKENSSKVLTYKPLENAVPKGKQEQPPKVTKPRAPRKTTIAFTLTGAMQEFKKTVK